MTKKTVKVYFYPDRNPEIVKGAVLDIAQFTQFCITKHEGLFRVRYIHKGGNNNLIAFMCRV